MSLTADTLEQRVIVGLELILGHINRSIKRGRAKIHAGNEGKWGVSQVDVAQDSNRWNKIFVI
jgi:hypothetical protein